MFTFDFSLESAVAPGFAVGSGAGPADCAVALGCVCASGRGSAFGAFALRSGLAAALVCGVPSVPASSDAGGTVPISDDAASVFGSSDSSLPVGVDDAGVDAFGLAGSGDAGCTAVGAAASCGLGGGAGGAAVVPGFFGLDFVADGASGEPNGLIAAGMRTFAGPPEGEFDAGPPSGVEENPPPGRGPLKPDGGGWEKSHSRAAS
jgi:hypothetical protein